MAPREPWRSYDEASKWAQAHGITSAQTWVARSKAKAIPSNIPSSPNSIYKDDWTDWGTFLGTGRIANRNHVHKPMAEVSAWAQAQGITTATQWHAYAKSNGLPDGFPSNPNRAYQKQWSGWGHFLGTGRIASWNHVHKPLAEASAWAQAQGITTREQWIARAKANDLMEGIPKDPYKAYKDEWADWGTFLGTGRIATQKQVFKPMEEVSAWAQARGLTSVCHWLAHTKREDFPDGFPVNPDQMYRNEWQGWPAFLGVRTIKGQSRKELILKRGLGAVLNLDDKRRTTVDPSDGGRSIQVDLVDRTRMIVIEYDGSLWHKNGDARDRRQTERLTKAGWTVIRVREAPLPLLDPLCDIQVAVSDVEFWPMIDVVLRHLESLVALGILADAGLVSAIQRVMSGPSDEADFADVWSIGWPPFEEVRGWARSQSIQSSDQWRKRTKEQDFPENYPKTPYLAYRAEWTTWGDFLGTNRVAAHLAGFMPMAEASAWARAEGITTQKEWKDRAKSDDFPDRLPTNPWRSYKQEWTTWGDFSGTNRVAWHLVVFKPMAEVSAWARGEGITTQKEWKDRAKADDFPDRFPANPQKTYKEEWTSWGDFLGTGRIATRDRVYKPLADLSAWAKAQGIRSSKHWQTLGASKGLPDGFPSAPDAVFKDEWTSWCDFLGTGLNPLRAKPASLPFPYIIRLAKPGENVANDWIADADFAMPRAA